MDTLVFQLPYDTLVEDAVLVPAMIVASGERYLSCRIVFDKRGRFSPGDRITTSLVLDTFRFAGGTLISTKNSVYVVIGEHLS